MKTIVKFLKYLVIVIFSLIILLVIIANVAENKITDIALSKMSKVIKAPLEIDEVSFTLLRKFPLATFELNGIWLGSAYDTTIVGSANSIDTLIKIEKIFISVKTRPLIKGEYEIVKVEFIGANFNYKIDSLGATNFDFLIPQTTEEEEDTAPSAPLYLDLKTLELKDICLNYTDDSIHAKAKIEIPELLVKAKALNDKYKATLEGSIRLTDVSFEGTNAHLMKETTLDFDVEYDDDKITMNEVSLITDGAKLFAKGTTIIKDSMDMDIQLEGSEINLSELIKYAPTEMLKEYGLKQLDGTMEFKALVKGIMVDSLIPNLVLSLDLKKGMVATTDYPALKNIQLSGQITNGSMNNNQTTSIVFDTFHFETEQSRADFTFSVTNIDHPKYNAKADLKLNMAEFKNFIPDTLVRSITGIVDLNFATKGQLPDSIGDDFTDYVLENSKATIKLHDFDINMDDTLKIHHFSGQMVYEPGILKINNLEMAVPTYDLALKNTSLDSRFKGKLTDTKSLDFEVKGFHFEMKDFEMDLTGTVKNFDHPTYDIQTTMTMELAEMMKFMPDSIVDSMSGTMILEVKSAATVNLDSIDAQMNDLIYINSAYNFNFKNVSIKQPNDTLMEIKQMYGNLTMDPEKVTINNMKCYMGGIEFGMDSTEILNVYETIIQERRDKNLIMHTNMSFGVIENAWIQAFMGTDTTATEPEDSNAIAEEQNNQIDTTNSVPQDSIVPYSLLPNYVELEVPHFIIRGKATAKRIVYEKNVLDDVSMFFRFSDSLYVIDQFKMTTCGGFTNSSFMLDARKNYTQPIVNFKNYTTNLDLRELLYVNDNFGDTVLTYDKVGGRLTSKMDVRAIMMGDSVPTDRIWVKGDFTIENGRLYNYQPLVDASMGIGGLKELDKMDFNTLKTSIFMFKNKVYVPKTDVVSNALDLSAFAMQSMGADEDFEYHIVLHLSDVLKGKSDKLMEEQAKQNKKDGTTLERNGLNLISMKVGNEKKNGFDNENLKTKFKNNLNKQEGFLNLLFFPNLVNFSTDLDRSAREREIKAKYSKSSE